VRVVLALARVTHRVPDLRWTQTGRATAPGSLPLTLTISPLIAVEGDNDRVDLTTAACAAETAAKGDTIAKTAINTTTGRQRDDPPASTPNLPTADPFRLSPDPPHDGQAPRHRGAPSP
jgi:hypothetical protein